jgi:hypothetical protein
MGCPVQAPPEPPPKDQSVRRWEELARIPKQADHGLRLVFRDLTQARKPLSELVRRVDAAEAREPNGAPSEPWIRQGRIT